MPNPAVRSQKVAASRRADEVDVAEVGSLAVSVALKAAKSYLDRHSLVAEDSALRACVSSWIKAKLPEALKDADAALACGMREIANETFAASMALAGIEAAKEAGFPAAVLS